MADNDLSQTVQEAVSTGTDNRVRLRPFTVTLNCPQRWDPSAEPLQVGYDVYDPNVRVRRGRLHYVVSVDGEDTTLYTMNLDPSRLRPGCYELTQGQRWDGTIRTGVDDRIGQRITADLSLLSVIVEVWNTDNAQPGESSSDAGRTNVQGEWIIQAVKNVEIDAIAEARWDRNWVIPDKNPDEPDKGRVSVTINVKNVAEGTPVRLEVMRIGEVPDPETDILYVDNSFPEEDEQPGMKDAVVRNGRIVVGDDNSKPVVVFNQYDEHWKYSGNNFYALWIGFGADGFPMLATERDYENNENQCLHMRFTVFIHDAASDLPDSRRAAQRLHAFFKSGTKYWRSYRMVNGPKDPVDWFKHYGRQYVVIFTGHSSCWCDSESHPTYHRGQGRRRREVPKRVPNSRFRPDQNVCPADVSNRRTGGCGEKNGVGHQLVLGRSPNLASLGNMRRKKLWLGNFTDSTNRNSISFLTEGHPDREFDITRYAPRLMFYADGCRTMLTTNLGEHFTENGTKYFHGWIYSVMDDVAAGMVVDLFRKWIKGTRADPAPTEFELNRFLDVYRREGTRTRGRRRYYARVMDNSGVLNPSNSATPASTAEALE
jgi:hypothetical protein